MPLSRHNSILDLLHCLCMRSLCLLEIQIDWTKWGSVSLGLGTACRLDSTHTTLFFSNKHWAFCKHTRATFLTYFLMQEIWFLGFIGTYNLLNLMWIWNACCLKRICFRVFWYAADVLLFVRTLLPVTLGRTAFEEAGLHACIIKKTISLLGFWQF